MRAVGHLYNDGMMEEGLMMVTLLLQQRLATLMKTCLLDFQDYLNLNWIVENYFVQFLLFLLQQAMEVVGYADSLLHFDHWYLLTEVSFDVELLHFLRNLIPEGCHWIMFWDEQEMPIVYISERLPSAEFQLQNYPYNNKNYINKFQ